MLWFKGSVSEAIAESRRIGSLFIVYIKGDDEQSRKMDAIWENEKINEVCLSDCTAIRILANSNDLTQFASIYPVFVIPCTYFLDGEGTPLEVIAASLPVEQFLDKINQTVQKHREKYPKVVSSPSISSLGTSSQAVASTSNGPIERKDNSEQALADRVARAKKFAEDKKKEKAEKEKEDARRKEAERRKEGQVLSKAKAEREEMLAQQMADRIKNEKAKDKAARDAIREKIAQDKAERAAMEEVKKQERRNVEARIDPRVDRNQTNVQCSEVRLQFRLPDGSSVIQNFPAGAVLDTAREFICSRMSFAKRVTFWTTFPRKHLVEEDFTKTLSELGLAPSAALIVDTTSASTSSGSASSSSSSIASLISLVLAPFLALLSLIKLLLFASPQQPRGAVQHEDTGQATTSASTSASSSSTPSSDVRRRTRDDNEQDKERFKKDGKIHSFKQTDKDDDENNTWNGNSTQQM